MQLSQPDPAVATPSRVRRHACRQLCGSVIALAMQADTSHCMRLVRRPTENLWSGDAGMSCSVLCVYGSDGEYVTDTSGLKVNYERVALPMLGF